MNSSSFLVESLEFSMYSVVFKLLIQFQYHTWSVHILCFLLFQAWPSGGPGPCLVWCLQAAVDSGNPLQYSCQRIPWTGGAWQATVHRVAKSQTGLKWLSTALKCWWIGLWLHPVSCLAWSIPELELQALGWSQVLVIMTQTRWQPPGEFRQMNTPRYVLHWCLCPQGEPEDLLRPAGRSASGFCEITAFALDPSVHEILCEPCGMSISPNSVVFLQSNPLDLHSQLLWVLPFPELDTWPPLGGLMWVSRVFTPVRELV